MKQDFGGEKMTPEELLEMVVGKRVCILCHSKEDRQALEDFLIETGWHLGFDNNDYLPCMYLVLREYPPKEIHGNADLMPGYSCIDINEILIPEVSVDTIWLSSQLFGE